MTPARPLRLVGASLTPRINTEHGEHGEHVLVSELTMECVRQGARRRKDRLCHKWGPRGERYFACSAALSTTIPNSRFSAGVGARNLSRLKSTRFAPAWIQPASRLRVNAYWPGCRYVSGVSV